MSVHNDALALRLAVRLAAPVPPAERRRARSHVLDWAGCAAAGAASPAGRAFASLGEGPGPCAAVGYGPASAASAAFVNGAFGTMLEMDDVDRAARLHPGPVVIPAALAAAQLARASGGALLEAVARGYQAAVRLGRALGDAHYALWHPTSTCGAVGAAAAAASVLGLDVDRMSHAIALAVTRTGGLWETRHDARSDAKQLHTALAAQQGLTAALAARAGLRGPARVLEGPEGLFAATAPGADPEAVLSGAAWSLDQISFKPWPACRHAHPVIDACLLLGGSPRPGPVRIRTYADAARFCDDRAPTTAARARFSLQHAAAAALLRGPPAIADFEAAAIADPEVAALREAVVVEVADPFASAYPAHFGASVTLPDGRSAAVADALGDPENPLSEERLIGKARMLCAHAGMRDPDRLIAAALALEDRGVEAFCAALPA
jgi:2-methylcitrate dehydratase PrpD